MALSTQINLIAKLDNNFTNLLAVPDMLKCVRRLLKWKDRVNYVVEMHLSGRNSCEHIIQVIL